ncbi:DUF3365 domain-containing protein [Pontibacter qinzhouensis]|uniref:DUF3365 domain-containing protein n=1 Tax=Pontibacter qinzhouensis TaxID=2603253 RepID=A0A5C8KEN9_9BACT|nr:DUF3365 domain-containing protein [Pontibacter qinzhouensis]TXK51308.1 DUF3365 domain-containing protein [Pontibacter qinzhouensis]
MFHLPRILYYITLAAACIVSGCEVKVKPVEGGKEIAKELERRKIKRVTGAQIQEAALNAGDSIVAAAQYQMDLYLQQHLDSGGVAAAMAYCRPEQFEIVQAMEQKYGGTAGRTSLKLRNPANKAEGAVAVALQQYTEGQLQEPVLQELNREELLYTAPIYIRSESCLRCHGTPGKELSDADNELLKQQYPTDQATRYATGDLRGMWHIRFNKQTLVTDMTTQPKKKIKMGF